MWNKELQAKIARGELRECFAVMSDGSKRPFLEHVNKDAGAGRAAPAPKAAKPFRAGRGWPPADDPLTTRLKIAQMRAWLNEPAKSAPAAPVTRAQFYVAQEMASDGISHGLAEARLRCEIDRRANELASEPGRFGTGVFPYADLANARRAVACWWERPY